MKLGAERLQQVAESATLAFSERARLMAQQGINVIDLAGGDPDFTTPAHIIEAAFTAAQKGATHYVSSRGIPAFLQAISDHYAAEQGLRYDPKAEILVTTGGKMALYLAILATVDRGDAVLVPKPAWVSYVPMVQLVDGVPVEVPLDAEDNFRLTREALEEKISPRTRALLINSPANPTGRVLTRQELEAAAEVALRHDLLVISDEIYYKLLYDGHQHISIATLPGMRERTIIVNGLSKTYAMTGWRLGFALAPKPIMSQMVKVQSHTISCAAAFAQHAGAVALTGPQDCVREMVDIYAQRRRLIVDGLNSLPGIRCAAPEGAFYAFPDISGTGMTSLEFCERMLEEAHVVMTPGSAFGPSGEGYVRLSFANATEKLAETVERLRSVL
ncbi:MAG: pyridoxal phosphate-dependent aminotransferase [Anaerolineae bacterium]